MFVCLCDYMCVCVCSWLGFSNVSLFQHNWLTGPFGVNWLADSVNPRAYGYCSTDNADILLGHTAWLRRLSECLNKFIAIFFLFCEKVKYMSFGVLHILDP